MLPNLLIVGAMKSGTTSLAEQLNMHPQIYMSPNKEPRFFCNAENWRRGVEWYESHFAGATDEKVVGEASTTYTMHPDKPGVPTRIAQVLDVENLHLLYIIRNPVDRLVSHYVHEWYAGRVSSSIEKAVERCPHLLNYSRYYHQIQQFLPHVPRGRWTLVLFEEFADDPVRIHRSIYDALGVDPTFVIEDLSARNVGSRKVRRSRFAEAVRRIPGATPVARALVPTPLRGRLARVGGRKTDKPVLSDDLRRRLTEKLLPDVEALSGFCGRDFAEAWELQRT